MSNFKELSQRISDPNFKKIFEVIGDKTSSGVLDTKQPISHSIDEIQLIRDSLYTCVYANLATSGKVKTLNDVTSEASKFVKDSFYNPVTGIGTPIDPGYFNTADIPISLSPMEATSFYSSGGIPRAIIDKKVKGIFLNDYNFKSSKWSNKDIETLKEYSIKKGFERVLKDGIRDGLIYGGSAIIPSFKRDTPVSYAYNRKQLKRFITKDSLDFIWNADRWNLVMVPNFNISDKDYLHPETMYCPIAGLNINTVRMALIKPNRLPYWGTLRQIGWGQSDFEGWIRSVMAYNIMMSSIPIMSQQMSLVYHEMPMDGIIAQNGPDAAQEFAEANSRALAEWSLAKPKTMNSFGKIGTIERNFSGYSDLAMLLRQDISAKSGVPESSLFYTQATGFTDNDSDTTVKQAETLKGLGDDIAPQLQPIIEMMIYSCFGPDSPQAETAREVEICFDSPSIVTDEQRAKLGSNFFSMIQTGTGSGMRLDNAAEVASQFIPDLEIDEEMIQKFKESQEKLDEREQLEFEQNKLLAEQKSAPGEKNLGSANQNKPESAKGGTSKNGENTTRMPSSTKASPGSENFLRRVARKISGKGRSGG